jgi:D-threo-aldose 1-dehydrogenase
LNHELSKDNPARAGFRHGAIGQHVRAIPEEALANVRRLGCWRICFFDTAPFYGSGLSEIRLGALPSTTVMTMC